MKELFQIGLQDADDSCEGLLPVVKLFRQGIIPIVQIVIPIILIVLGTIDLGKAVIVSDDKKIKEAQSMLIKRAIYAAAIFFITTIVVLLMGIVAKGADSSEVTTDTWKDCWEAAAPSKK